MNVKVDVPGQILTAQIGTSRGHIAFFDGLRGILCLWIFIYHASVMIGYETGLIPAGAQAVDIFMFISGFVMAYTLSVGGDRRSISHPDKLIVFYLKRLIRIIPVYYLVLLLAVVFFASFSQFAHEAAAAFPPKWAAQMRNDPSLTEITPANIVLHMTFLFGLNPHYASNMPIPDWSLTLEMQFYAIVPFLLIAMRKYGLSVPITVLAIGNFLVLRYIGLYLTPKIGGLFPQPSMRLFKIDCFLIGMLLALYFVDERFNKTEIVCWLLILVYLEQSFIFATVVAVCFTLLSKRQADRDLFARWSSFSRAILQSRPIVFFGEISYDFYLLHLLVLMFVVHVLLRNGWYAASPAAVRFGILLSISAIVVIPAAYLVHIFVEVPCQKAGRPICAWVLARKNDWRQKAIKRDPIARGIAGPVKPKPSVTAH